MKSPLLRSFWLRSAGTALAIWCAATLDADLVPSAIAAPDFQYVRTESGRLRCLIHIDRVACEAGGPGSNGFPQAPIALAESQCRNPCPGGIHYDIAEVTTTGAFKWTDGNIGGGGTPQNDLLLTYGQTVHSQGWTINPDEGRTRFTKDVSGHGMLVSIENVSSF
jgi:hypothetical protein